MLSNKQILTKLKSAEVTNLFNSLMELGIEVNVYVGFDQDKSTTKYTVMSDNVVYEDIAGHERPIGSLCSGTSLDSVMGEFYGSVADNAQNRNLYLQEGSLPKRKLSWARETGFCISPIG